MINFTWFVKNRLFYFLKTILVIKMATEYWYFTDYFLLGRIRFFFTYNITICVIHMEVFLALICKTFSFLIPCHLQCLKFWIFLFFYCFFSPINFPHSFFWSALCPSGKFWMEIKGKKGLYYTQVQISINFHLCFFKAEVKI